MLLRQLTKLPQSLCEKQCRDVNPGLLFYNCVHPRFGKIWHMSFVELGCSDLVFVSLFVSKIYVQLTQWYFQ